MSARLECLNCGHTDRDHQADGACLRCPCMAPFLIARAVTETRDCIECPSCSLFLDEVEIDSEGTCRYCDTPDPALREWIKERT